MAKGQLSMNLATTRGAWGFAEAVDGCLRHGVTAISPWRDQVAAIGLDEAARIVKANGLRVTGLCRGGMFPGVDAADRQKRIDDNFHAIDEAAALGADCLVLVVGGLPGSSRDIAEARKMVADGIAAIVPHARSAGIPLAIEPLHPMYAADRACVNTLAHANDLCDELDGLGIALDAYHVWWDPDLPRQIARAGRRVISYHVCDWLVPTTDFLLDRGMMGDGVIDLKGLRKLVEAQGYAGHVDVEIFSASNWWTRDPDEVLRVCLERFRTVV